MLYYYVQYWFVAPFSPFSFFFVTKSYCVSEIRDFIMRTGSARSDPAHHDEKTGDVFDDV